MPLLSFKCPLCGASRDVLLRTWDADDGVYCGCKNDVTVEGLPMATGMMVRMQRQPSAPSFRITGAAYRNGYQGDSSK